MEEVEIGRITHYFDHISVGAIQLTAPLAAGDEIHIKGHTTDFTEKVNTIQLEHETVQEAQAGQNVGINVSERVREHDIVYKIIG